MVGERIRVTGIVQGVGFRPTVWRLARDCGITGQVWNDAEGVLIHAWAARAQLQDFVRRIEAEQPTLARIDKIVCTPLDLGLEACTGFHITHSRAGMVHTAVAADAATCAECLAEVHDAGNRRYRYPFTNCTHCGPRLSIVRSIPYDRANTSMQPFTMCAACQAEYDNPEDRRFHAQPNACSDCGPSLWIENSEGERVADDQCVDDIAYAASLIQQGSIVAIKGIGGFHLACDATHVHAVSRLRQRKQRYHKPFALMARDVALIRQYAQVSGEAARLLQDVAAPIVLLSMHAQHALADDVAPDQDQLGFMLPYTPLHALLLQELDFPVVMTSGNRSDEAQCISNQQASEQLAGIADYFVFHDRDIVNRVDDSVLRVVDRQAQIMRRARGYAPSPLTLPEGFENSPAVLAMGAELKNTFCLVKDGKALLSQHQGDLEDASVFHDYRHNIDHYQQLFDNHPQMIAIDRHPEYLSTKLGQQMAAAQQLELIEVQHHHAHIAACMAEHGLPLSTRPVLGIALDGLGYGDNGELWGAEFLLADYHEYRRLASFQPIAMPGGSKAILEPWRNTFAYVQQTLGWAQVEKKYPHIPFVKFMQQQPLANLITMIDNGLNSPQASSAGRLFDAMAALLGFCRDAVSHEGQAAMQLEVSARKALATDKSYSVDIDNSNENALLVIQWQSFWQQVLDDIAAGVSADVIAATFHNTLIVIIVDMVERLARQHDIASVVLSGGVMQNRLLHDGLIKALSGKHVTVLVPHQVPANDGGIAFGQAVVAIARSQT